MLLSMTIIEVYQCLSLIGIKILIYFVNVLVNVTVLVENVPKFIYNAETNLLNFKQLSQFYGILLICK